MFVFYGTAAVLSVTSLSYAVPVDYVDIIILSIVPILYCCIIRSNLTQDSPSVLSMWNHEVLYQPGFNRSPLVRHFFLLLKLFGKEKYQLPGFGLTSQRVRRFGGDQLNHRGRCSVVLLLL